MEYDSSTSFKATRDSTNMKVMLSSWSEVVHASRTATDTDARGLVWIDFSENYSRSNDSLRFMEFMNFDLD